MGDECRRRILAAIARWDQARNTISLAPHERRALAAAIDVALTRPSADARLMAALRSGQPLPLPPGLMRA